MVFDDHTGAAGVSGLPGVGAVVTQRLPPRLAVVRLPAAHLPALRSAGGVRAVCLPGDPVPDGLGESEQLFARAWQVRGRPKERTGDGLAWDAPGFEPPDPRGR